MNSCVMYYRVLNPMKTLVTGAQGCIGSWVVKRLIEAGRDVLTFDVNDSTARLEMIAGSGVLPERSTAGSAASKTPLP